MAAGGRDERKPRPRARSEAAAAPAPRGFVAERPKLAWFIPTARSLLTALLIVAGAGLAWMVARETSVFSVSKIEVAGGPAGVHAQVRRALQASEGKSLLEFDLDASARAVEALPTVASVRFDRAFPHTLRVVVVPERPVALVRQGKSSYVVAESGRVIATATRTQKPALARIWIRRDVQLEVGARAEGDLLAAVAAVTPLVGSGFPGRVSSVTATPLSLGMRLRSGLEIRLGESVDVALKLAVAARVIPLLTTDTTYLDVSVPDRPVSGTLNSQVEPEVSVSTRP